MCGIAIAAAQDPERSPRPRIKQELGLSDQQVSQLRELRLESRKAAIRRHAETRLARLGLRELVHAPSVDEKALQARIRELSDLHAAKLRARVDAQLALRKILTPEQLEQLSQLRAKRPRPRRPGPRRGGGDDAEREALTRPDVR